MLYLWRVTWSFNDPNAERVIWEREAPTAQDALVMWKAETHRRNWHPDNRPVLQRIECVPQPGYVLNA